MKRFLLFISISFLLSAPSFAAHIIGGEMRYEYISPGVSPNSKIYRIIMILFKGDDPLGAPLAPSYIVAIYNNDNGVKFPGTAGSTGNNWVITRIESDPLPPVPIVFPSCIQNAPILNYTYATYSMTVELPDNSNGYTIVYQTCCRINGLQNVANSTGSTYTCSTPGSNQLSIGNDSSPLFSLPINVICKNAPFTLNFSATDPNADSLVYSLCNAYNGGLAVNAGFDDPAPPPYGSANYNFPYSGANPFGTGIVINPQTGVISGIAPDFGKYVVCVCVNVYRNGVLIATHRKDLIVQVSDCEITQANPMPNFVTCDGFTVNFSHTSTGANTVFWDFGDPTALTDTSNANNPSWDYTTAGAGTYIVKFVINRGTSCSDSTTRVIGVFPGFFPGFTVSGACFTNPFLFTDTTRTNYGVVDSWSWNFGDLTTIGDTSHLQNTSWTYPAAGPKDVTFIVTNSKGCKDTVQQTITVLDKPALALAFADTLICRNDAVQLNAIGTGVFSWTPLINIINPNTANPTVSPTSTTWYYVTLTNNSCVNQDSVRVRVVNSVTLSAINDTTICQGDAIQLGATSDGLSFSWTPVANLNNPNIINPIAITNNTTTYQVVASIGSCSATDQVVVTTVPYPGADAGGDPTICYNTSAQLNASMVGISFNWSPALYLNNATILNPIATPPRTTAYILSVYDTLGCPKPGRDTVVVTVRPKIRAFAGRDTSVIVGQPLQLNGSGGVGYLWSPSTGLNNVTIHNPIGVYGQEIDSVHYKLVVTDLASCADSAFVTVRVFKTKPSVFVPTAFTPNGDGRNDVIRPIAVGIQKINYFSIYNRWGQMVFSTTINGHGWDGKVAGTPQGSGVFVWMVSAIDYLGKPLFLKGTVTLIR